MMPWFSVVCFLIPWASKFEDIYKYIEKSSMFIDYYTYTGYIVIVITSKCRKRVRVFN